MKKRFDHANEALENQRGYAGVKLPNGVSRRDACEELYSRLGAEFPVEWEPWSPAEPVIDINDLPNGVSESDVESALSGMKADGLL